MKYLPHILCLSIFFGLLLYQPQPFFGAPKTPEERIADTQAASLTNTGKYTRNIDNLPAGYEITEYVSPKGAGYQITRRANGKIHSVGFGPEAKERTYTLNLETDQLE